MKLMGVANSQTTFGSNRLHCKSMKRKTQFQHIRLAFNEVHDMLDE